MLMFHNILCYFKTAKKNRMRPQAGFAWNMGWGKLHGDWGNHVFEEGEGVRDYRMASMKPEHCLQTSCKLPGRTTAGRIGDGRFLQCMPMNEDDPWVAFRATYKITAF